VDLSISKTLEAFEMFPLFPLRACIINFLSSLFRDSLFVAVSSKIKLLFFIPSGPDWIPILSKALVELPVPCFLSHQERGVRLSYLKIV